MSLVKETDPQKLIPEVAGKLKAVGVEMPEWAKFVKTGPSKERPPQQEDWWCIRGASILRQVYLQKQGVSKLRKSYSGRKNRGHKPEHTFKGSGKIVRVLLKQLETAGYVKIEKGCGRVITPAGQKFLDSAAKGLR